MRTQIKFIQCLTLSLMLILLSGCETNISDACASLHKLSGDQGYGDRWTRNEKEQADSIDTWIDKNCR